MLTLQFNIPWTRRGGTRTSQDALIWVHVSGLGATIANGVGSKGNGGGDPAGITFCTFSWLLWFLQWLFTISRLSSPLSIVASKDNNDIVVMQMVADVISAVRRPHLSTMTRDSIVLKTFTTPSDIKAVISATSANRAKWRSRVSAHKDIAYECDAYSNKCPIMRTASARSARLVVYRYPAEVSIERP